MKALKNVNLKKALSVRSINCTRNSVNFMDLLKNRDLYTAKRVGRKAAKEIQSLVSQYLLS